MLLKCNILAYTKLLRSISSWILVIYFGATPIFLQAVAQCTSNNSLAFTDNSVGFSTPNITSAKTIRKAQKSNHSIANGSNRNSNPRTNSNWSTVSLSLKALDITNGQKQEIHLNRTQARLKLTQLRETKTTKIAQLKALLFDPKATEFQIRNCANDIQAVQAAMENINLECFIKLRSILTSQQKEKLACLKPTITNSTKQE